MTVVPRPVRIVIADDHPVVRQGLKYIVESEPDLSVVAEASSAEEVLTAPLGACDVLVLDLGMPGAVGLSLLSEVRARFTDLPILILSIIPEEQFAIRALQAGASGYISKRSASELLVEAVRQVVDGGLYMSETVSRRFAMEAFRPPVPGSPIRRRLSNREIEIVRLYAVGLSLTKIAEQLHISVKTVSTHRRRLMTKLGLDSNAALIRYALRERLIES